jgi:hypothetical protein
MGKRNRERRAAKQRARQRQQSGKQWGSAQQRRSDWPGGPFAGGGHEWSEAGHERAGNASSLAFELAAAQLLSAAEAHARGDAAAVPRCAADLVHGRLGAHPRWVDAAADLVVRRTVRVASEAGWLPVDLYQATWRRLDPVAAAYVVDAIAGVSEEQGEAALDALWCAQLDEVDAQRWWSPDRPHLPQWALRHGSDRAEALSLVIRVLALLSSLGPIDRVAPGRAARGGVDEKILARVRSLLAKAESTEFPDEAEALSAKAQELMSRYSLHRAMVEHDRGLGPRPTARRIWLDNPYVSAKTLLVDVVAGANRSRAVFSSHWGFVTVLGDEVDLDIVELLSTSLLVQATNAMMAAGRQFDGRGRVSRTRSFRQSFLVAYAQRIGERLAAAAQAEVESTDQSRLLPILADRSRAVDELFSAMFPRLVHKSVSASNAAGWGAGRAAADLARLDVLDAVESAGA